MSRFSLEVIDKSFDIDLNKKGNNNFVVKINGKDHEAVIEDISGPDILVSVGGALYSIKVQSEPKQSKLETIVNGHTRVVGSPELFGSKKITFSKNPQNEAGEIQTFEPSQGIDKPRGPKEGILAPMPGKVVAVSIKVGDSVKVGDVVVILEAMKMENEITSERDGKIMEINVKEGDSVDAHDVLAVVG